MQSGETLGHIALRYHTTAAVLRQLNGLDGDRIKIGAHLVIPGAENSGGDPTPTRDTAEKRESRNTKKVVHGVQPGDTLSDLARYYGVTVQQLASWNGISTKDYLQPGQELVLHTR